MKAPSANMVPTVSLGQHFLVDTHSRNPRRGDVVVYAFPQRPETRDIARVIGLPDDWVLWNNRQIILNEVPLPEETTGPDTYRQQLENKSFQFIYRKEQPDEAGRYKVPPREVFILNDNRGETKDSRLQGPVPLENIHGTVVYAF